MGEHPNVAIFRQAMEAFNAGDSAGFVDSLAADVVWHQIDGGTLNGRDAVMASMSGFADIDFTGEVHDVVANDDHLIGLINAHVKVGDQEISYRTAEIIHMSDGKITERWAFSDDPQAIVEFFSQLEG
ncbi:MAG: nuclear transport factor 2 family protein [Acidobacteria bacterium]|nr:nuclear transport factor 2 family protein [Acidobacteriota bacterium]